MFKRFLLQDSQGISVQVLWFWIFFCTFAWTVHGVKYVSIRCSEMYGILIDHEEKQKQATARLRSQLQDQSVTFSATDGSYIRRSHQECSVENNIFALAQMIFYITCKKALTVGDQSKIEQLRGTLEILKLLVICKEPISFEEAFELFNGYQSRSRNTQTEKLEFRDILLHPEYGI